MKSLKRVLIMAGGTGGHVFPGLAMAKFLQERGVEVQWLGTALGLEASVVPAENIPLHFISIGGVRGKNLKTFLLAPFRIIKALVQSLQVLRKFKPDVVLGLGGFVSGPGGLAAWLLRHPLIIHEQNAKAGLTNQCLQYLSKKVLTGFPKVLKAATFIGNPVRKELTTLPSPSQRFANRPQKWRLLVIGGSLGAQVFNQLLPTVLASMPLKERPEVYHQSGIKLYEETLAAYRRAGVEARIEPFIADMQAAYAWADLVLGRAGALTLAELTAVGLGAILIPYPYAVDDHQTTNAQYLVQAGAAILIQQRDLSAAFLQKLLSELSAAPQQRLAMAEAAYQLRKTKVLEEIFKACCEQV